MSNQVSSCCSAGLIEGREHDARPLGTHEFNGNGITYKTLRCEKCQKECDAVEACECCGEAAEHLVETRLGDWCTECCQLYAEEIMEKEVKRIYA